MTRRDRTQIVRGRLRRPAEGPVFEGVDSHLPTLGEVAWQSHGGASRRHPARSLPYTLDVDLPLNLRRIHVVGILARFASRAEEAPGTLGASVQLLSAGGEIVFRQDLLNGRHYGDALDLESVEGANGDGTSRRTAGSTHWEGETYRVDVLTLDVDADGPPEVLRFKDLGSPASFAIFDLFFEVEEVSGCPFHPSSGGIGLGEIGAIVRMGDRVRFSRAVEQLEASVTTTPDLDEARGQALTFLAVLTAATLELGASRSMHRLQLDAAREMDRMASQAEVADCARRQIETVAGALFRPAQSPSAYLVDRALALVDRNFARNLSDATVAAQLGLSTSHFRFLFKESTGQPFHKYVVALRLEKARQMLLDEDVSVSTVAKAVGFTGLSHFSRAFTQRFDVSPTSIRRKAI